MSLRRRLIGMTLLIALGAGGLLIYLALQQGEPHVGELTLYGNVDLRDVRVAFRVSEYVKTLHVDEGDAVTRGQLLAELDDRRLRETVAEREAEYRLRQQELLELERGSRPEDIDAARGEVAALEAELAEARRNYARQADLLAEKLVAQERVDAAQAARDSLAGRLRAARARLQRLIAGPRVEQIEAARARFAAADAALARARTDLADAELHAPADGVIQNRLLEPGDIAGPQAPVFSLALTNPLWVRAYVPEPDLGKLREGMAASVTSDSFPGETFDGWVGFISPTAEFTPKNVETPELRTRLVYRVRVFVCNAGNRLRLGMPVTVTVKPAAGARAACGPD